MLNLGFGGKRMSRLPVVWSLVKARLGTPVSTDTDSTAQLMTSMMTHTRHSARSNVIMTQQHSLQVTYK